LSVQITVVPGIQHRYVGGLVKDSVVVKFNFWSFILQVWIKVT